MTIYNKPSNSRQLVHRSHLPFFLSTLLTLNLSINLPLICSLKLLYRQVAFLSCTSAPAKRQSVRMLPNEHPPKIPTSVHPSPALPTQCRVSC
jgi:hypothetical protein